MAKLQNTFEFVGNLKLMKEKVKETTFDSGWTKRELKAILKESEGNGQFLSLEGGFYKSKGEPDKVFSFTKSKFGESGGKLEIPWSERKNPEIVNNVANFSKTIIDLTVDQEIKDKYYALRGKVYEIESNENASEEDKVKLKELYEEIKKEVPHRYEFLHELDALEFIEKLADKLDGKRLKIKGEVSPSYWNGNFRFDYKVKTIEIPGDEEVNGLKLDLDLYFNKDVINDSLFKSKKLYSYDTHILAYDSQTKKEQFFPLTTVLDASKYDLDNPKHQGHINIVNKFFDTKKKELAYQLPYSAKLVSGAEIVEFSEKDLTEDQKFLIDSGFASLNDFKPAGGNSFGDKVEQIRLLFPKIKNLGDGLDFTKGAKETLFKATELVYKPKSDDGYTKPPKVEDKSVSSDPFEFDEDSLPF